MGEGAPAPPAGRELACAGLRFSFPGAAAPLVDGLDLTAGAGQITALVGPSGCGKSTLLRLAAGLLQPSGGTIAGRGGEAAGDTAFVFQSPTLLPWRDVAANVGLPLELAGVGAAERAERVAAALEEVGLSEAALRLPHELSGGMRMRASLARAFLLRPRLLLLDEAFSALDALTRHEAWVRFLSRWRRDRPTVLLVTHDVDEAVLLADRVVALGDRPLRVRGSLEVGLERPRSPEQRHDPELARQARRLVGWL